MRGTGASARFGGKGRCKAQGPHPMSCIDDITAFLVLYSSSAVHNFATSTGGRDGMWQGVSAPPLGKKFRLGVIGTHLNPGGKEP